MRPFRKISDHERIQGFDLVVEQRPCAREDCSGDFVAAETTDASGGALVVFAGDVVGHGSHAASIARHVVESLLPHVSPQSTRPHQILEEIHAMLAPIWVETGEFVAAICLVADSGARSLTAAHAGWPQPLMLLGPGGLRDWELPGGGLLGQVGIQPGNEQWMEFVKTEVLCFYSDGVPEAFGPDGSQFGVSGIRRALDGGTPRQGASNTARRLMEAVWQHSGSFLSDDATVISIAWHA